MQALTAGIDLGGRFRLIRPAGRGGMGEVWLAEEVGTERRVALKFLIPSLWASSSDAAFLRAEFDQARRLVHPGIVRLHELVNDQSLTFLVMQYVEGGNIGALRGAGYRLIVRELLPVAEALEYAHRQGVIHRDLKPSNILRDVNGQCLIADFGLSGGGSLPAMSPQQLDGQPASVADDVYGFGALLFDLLTGQPLFHPDVTPERIRDEIPSMPATDLTGERLPAPLIRLLGSLLQKSATQRPPAMGAVRAALEDILREDQPAGAVAGNTDVIRSRERSRPADIGHAPQASAQARYRSGERRGLAPAILYGGVGILALVVVVVVFYLPVLVRGRAPLLTTGAPATPAATTPGPAVSPAVPGAPVPQEILDATLGEFLRNDDELRKVGAPIWGGADWAELRRVAQAGDEAYRRRDMAPALDNYHQAATLSKALLARAPEVLKEALNTGQAALAAGDQAKAVAQFETAVAVDATNAEAQRGLDRAQKLDQVLALMKQGSAAESGGQAAEALDLYRQAGTLDPTWSPASAGVSRLEQTAARDAYEKQMARGFAAIAGKDLASGRAAFEAALRVRPGDADARAALAQIDADEKVVQLTELQTEARSLEQKEQWREAVQRYEAALAADPNLQDLRQGLERARQRADMDEQLRKELGNADRFNDDEMFGRARALLVTAQGIGSPGPVLRQQIADLDQLLRVAATPVPVTLESDNQTEVTVFKVGRLGIFGTRTLELRPGTYTAVGSRPGYRDVRRNFRVAPGNETATVIVRCEEPI